MIRVVLTPLSVSRLPECCRGASVTSMKEEYSAPKGHVHIFHGYASLWVRTISYARMRSLGDCSREFGKSSASMRIESISLYWPSGVPKLCKLAMATASGPAADLAAGRTARRPTGHIRTTFAQTQSVTPYTFRKRRDLALVAFGIDGQADGLAKAHEHLVDETPLLARQPALQRLSRARARHTEQLPNAQHHANTHRARSLGVPRVAHPT
jgi:hypothetical protein